MTLLFVFVLAATSGAEEAPEEQLHECGTEERKLPCSTDSSPDEFAMLQGQLKLDKVLEASAQAPDGRHAGVKTLHEEQLETMSPSSLANVSVIETKAQLCANGPVAHRDCKTYAPGTRR